MERELPWIVVIGMRGVDQVASIVDRYRAEPPNALWQQLGACGLIQQGA
jgi:hypothetical protein